MNGIEKLNIEKNNNQTLIKILIDKNYEKELQDNKEEVILKITEKKNEPPDKQLKPLKDKKIIIDPGHGGTSFGAVGQTGVREKDLNLQTSLIIEKLLTNLGAKAILTRIKDENVTLAQRVNVANNNKGDLFISVHYNGYSDPQANGTETYWSSQGTKGSEKLAALLQTQLLEKLQRRNRGVKQANFYVLRETKMPAALIEPLFITNPVEEQIIIKEENMVKVAEGVVDAILKFYS
ncbi:N-acetylmuramoyl-L-alanine amidase family protein [Anaerobranca gottschalkii]|uniref:N-acetylmuramoyl-L-alanine amidase n=1 Tax=Anaerobranca gottschalkii DSM 13577 TaxID=1120990 RepID=A0A1I0BEX9_9FIRM|nr:N-acetylmuramoyl-L-alanine amidase [Anaerobranca gottschalkii]SET05342.1 N-acetylmuramoyl-L-alanine amidase [Anaerobranca gottschalkii DSM 13577]